MQIKTFEKHVRYFITILYFKLLKIYQKRFHRRKLFRISFLGFFNCFQKNVEFYKVVEKHIEISFSWICVSRVLYNVQKYSVSNMFMIYFTTVIFDVVHRQRNISEIFLKFFVRSN